MAKKTIKAQMKQRRDTKANWAATNPVLLDGELGIVSDDPNLYKVGDGATAWNSLPFRGFDGTLAQELGTSPNAVISQKAATDGVTEALINARIFSGNGWIETQPYSMYPDFDYEFKNIGNNPIIAAGVVGANNIGAVLDGWKELNPGETIIVRPSGEVAEIRFYFNGPSSLRSRTLLNLDQEIKSIKANQKNLSSSVDERFKVIDTPFSNANALQYYQNYTPLAIKAVQVITKNQYQIPNLGIQIFWKDVDGNWLIRISETTAAGTEIWGNWSKNNYIPETPKRDLVTIQNGDTTVRLTIDWDSIEAGASWSHSILVFNPECYFITEDTDEAIKDDNGTMQDFIDGIIDAKFFAKTYKELRDYKFVLAYFWKNYGENKASFIRVRMIAPNLDDNYARVTPTNPTDTVEEYTFGDGRFYFKIDWSKVPDGLAWSGSASFNNILTNEAEDRYEYEGYSTKDCTKNRVYISQDGTKDFKTFGEAYAAITDSSYTNQYEIVVCPGSYDEYNLTPPPFTHTYGLYPNTVKVTSRNWANTGDTLPVFDQKNHPSKLSNLTIESWTGYCIHFDIDLSNVSLRNENLHLIKQHYPGAMMSVIGGGSFLNGARYEWKSCIFECVGADGNASCHTQANTTGDNTALIFDACSFIRCCPRIGSVGAFGKCTCEITNCNFGYGLPGLQSWFSPIRSIDNPEQYLANRMEWGVIGGGNKNFAVAASNTIRTIRLLADSPLKISGTAVPYIFGNNYKAQDKHSNRIKCSVTSMYYIEDTQAGMEGYSVLRDVYQLWKRLGDCSVTPKTLSVEVDGITRSHVFNDNYLESKTPEADILAEMANSLNNCEIEILEDTGIGYDFINTTDKMYIPVTDDDILTGEFITRQGRKATRETPVNTIVGMVVKDTVKGESAPVWTSALFVGIHGGGDIGLSENGELYWTGADRPIGFISNAILYPYY